MATNLMATSERPPEDMATASTKAMSESEIGPDAEEGRSLSEVEHGATPAINNPKNDHNTVDWDGPNDPQNPMNWSTTKKVTTLSIVSFITFLSPLASTMIAPSTGSIMKEFHSSSEILAAFLTSIYLLGYAFGPLVIAPLSELYGRVIIYNICNCIFFIFNIACAVANNLGSLLAFRLFTGIAASCPLTIGAGSIADMIAQERRGLAMSFWVLGPLLGPTIGPVAGGYLSQAKGWRWNFWLLSILGGVVTVLTFILMGESYAYVLLKRKTKRLQKASGNLNLRSALDTGKSPKGLFAFSIIRPMKMIFLSPIVFLLSLYLAIIYSFLYLCFTTFPRVFNSQYGFSNSSSGLAYLGIGVGSIFGLFLCGAISDRLLKLLSKKNGGAAKPEYRLPTMIVGAISVPIGLFWYGWTAEYKLHWILPIIGTAFLGGGMVIVFMASSTYLIDAYPIYAASATAAGTVFRSLFGALLPLAGNSMYNALGVEWGTSVLGFIAIGFIPVPFFFLKYGQRIRESKFFQVDF